MEKVSLNEKEAQSYFILAQILIIIAGFAFTTAGLFYNNSQTIMIQKIAIVNNLIIQHEQLYKGAPPLGDLDFTYELGKDFDILQEKSFSLFIMSVALGLVLVLLSILTWSHGKNLNLSPQTS